MHTDTCEVTSSPVEAQVPLAHHVGGVAGLAQPLGQRVHVRRQTARLARSDDGVLESCVDLISGRKKDLFLVLYKTDSSHRPAVTPLQ